MDQSREVPNQWKNEGEKELTMLRTMLNRYTTKGLNPDAVMKISDIIMQANAEIRQDYAILPETLTKMKATIEKYKGKDS